jgi:hypothetical protein
LPTTPSTAESPIVVNHHAMYSAISSVAWIFGYSDCPQVQLRSPPNSRQ